MFSPDSITYPTHEHSLTTSSSLLIVASKCYSIPQQLFKFYSFLPSVFSDTSKLTTTTH